MPQVTEQYPETHEYLQHVPPHIVDRLGDIAVNLSHEDIPPQRETEGRGRAWLRNAFSRVVTDPAYDQSLLSADAIEASRLGQESLSSTMNTAAKLLGAAHSKLVDDGFQFGAEDLETDEQRDDREHIEHRAVYNEAFAQAVDDAWLAKQEGRKPESVKILEATLLLNHVEGHIGDQHVFRDALRAGLVEELIDACKETRKFVQGEEMARVVYGGVDFGVNHLLQLYTGKHINSDFSEGEDLDPESLKLINIDRIRDAVAAATTPGSWYTPANAIKLITGFNNSLQVGDNIKVNPHLNASEAMATEYCYKVAASADYPGEIGVAFECNDPLLAIETGKRLGLNPETVITMFADILNTGYNVRQLNTEEIDEMAKLKAQYPEEFYAVVDIAKRSRLSVKPAEFTNSFDRLIEAGIDPKSVIGDMKQAISFYGGIAEAVDQYLEIFSEFGRQGVEPAKVEQTLRGAGLKLASIRSALRNGQVSAEYIVSNALMNKEIISTYVDIYRNMDFKDSPPHALPELAELSYITDRIVALGIPEAVSKAMLKSWVSFDALAERYFTKDDTFEFPDTTPDEKTLHEIASRQTEALTTQLGKFEEFVQKYGIDTARGVIETFGIYNFSKHSVALLDGQYEAWKSGAEIKTVVVAARSDWNCFTTRRGSYDDEAGDGVFAFEAGSGAGAARIAVMVGKHERENGREPNIQRFIINGHGTPDSIQMDYDQEISTLDYRVTAESVGKIGAREVNDYKRHLGANFKLILQACSVAGKSKSGKNLASTMSESHEAPVDAYQYNINGVNIHSDGSVTFNTRKGDGNPINYRP